MKINKNTEEVKLARVFTDRVNLREVFWNKYNGIKSDIKNYDDVSIINYYGFGGIGKSGLIRELQKELNEKENNPYYLFYDFGLCQDVYSIIRTIRKDLIERYNFNFPKLDIALHCYSKKIGDKLDKEEKKSIIESSRIMSMIADSTSAIPQLSAAVSLFKAADSGIAWVRNKLDKKYSQEVSKLDAESAENILNSLPSYFAQDMEINLEKIDKPFVIFLDTYEKLVDTIGNDAKANVKDLWLRDRNGLVRKLPNSLWVISGREKLNWEKYDSNWSEAIESHLLEDLSLNDTKAFLTNAGIEDEKIKEELYKLTHGTPVYLDICVNTLEVLKNNNEEITIDKFGANTEELLERFIRYMDNQTREITHLLCFMNIWTDSLISDVGAKIIPSFSSIIYESLKKSSFIMRKNDMYYVHNTVRSVINKACPELIKQNYYSVMYNYLFNYLNSTNNVMKECYSGYLDMYKVIVINTLNNDNVDKYIVDYLKIYHNIKSVGNTKLSRSFIYQGASIFPSDCKNSYILQYEIAEYNLDIGSVYNAVFQCMAALSKILSDSICDIYGIYKILSIEKSTIRFIPREMLFAINEYLKTLEIKNDVLLDEYNLIYGKTPEYYMFKAKEILCKILDYTNNDLVELFINNIDGIKKADEKVDITINFANDVQDECYFYDYGKITESLAFCEVYLNVEKNYQDFFECNVAHILADLGKIFSKEQFFNKEKALYWISKAEQVSKDYYNNEINTLVYVRECKVSALLEIDKKEATQCAKDTIKYIKENYLDSQFDEIVFSPDFASIASISTSPNEYLDKEQFNKLMQVRKFFLELADSETLNLYEYFKKRYPDVMSGIDKNDFTDISMIMQNINKVACTQDEKFKMILKIYRIIYEYYMNEVKLDNKKQLMFLESLIATIDFYGGDSLNYRLKYLEVCKNEYGEHSYNTLDGYDCVATYYKSINDNDTFCDVCLDIMACLCTLKNGEKSYFSLFYNALDSIGDYSTASSLYEGNIEMKKEYIEKDNVLYYSTLEFLSELKCKSEDNDVIKSGVLDKIKILEELKKKLPSNHLKIINLEIQLALSSLEINLIRESIVFAKEAEEGLQGYETSMETSNYLKKLNIILYIYINCGLKEDAKELAKHIKALLVEDVENYEDIMNNCTQAENM